MARIAIEQERVIWAAATLIERDWGAEGKQKIRQIINDLIEHDDIKGVEIWLRVSHRFEQLSCPEITRPT